MNNKFLIDLYFFHKDWVNIVRSFGELKYAEDIVQEMYIKLAKHEETDKFYKQGTIYKGFIWIILRNMYYDFDRQKKKIQLVSINEAINIPDKHEPIEKFNARNRLDSKIAKTIKAWHFYDVLLFNIYREEGLSIRKIHAATGISTKSIQITIQNCKKSLKKEVGEDYEDFINEDFELIL